MKLVSIIAFLAAIFHFNVTSFSQTVPEPVKIQEIESVHIDRNFDKKYKRALKNLIRVYPLALEAKASIDQLEKELKELEKKRKQKKYIKESEKELKTDFEYTLKDLYVSEGRLLMKLIHRETGMTVDEILRKYKGNLNASTTGAALKMFGHDTKIKYDPLSEDWIVELVIQDIQNGVVKADFSPRKLNKDEYKVEMKTYRETKRVNTKARKEKAKKIRKQKKESK
jgi:hypothetical protein